MELTSTYINSLAPNSDTITNGKSLVKKGSFKNLKISPDKTLIFGECQGSGKNPYICSMDFIDSSSPIPRCSCPSRQIPCKHVLGLMYAYAQGEKFTTVEIPEDILSKRDKAVKRAENKEKKISEKKTDLSTPPSKAKINSALKRIDVQLEGIGIAEKLIKNIMQMGLAGIDARTQDALQKQIVQLGNYHIKGIQEAFSQLFLYIKEDDTHYSRSITQLVFIQALLKKASEHLNNKKADPEKVLTLDISSKIEEQIGHIWKLEELYAYNSFIQNGEIIQLSFNVQEDLAKKEFVDEGFYICLQNGMIYTTKNYRPFKSVKYINQDDTIFDPLLIEELYIYPGGINPRIRFNKYTMRQIKQDDYTLIKSFASDTYAETTKNIKNQLKNPLEDKNPVALLMISDIYTVKSPDGQISIVITDSKGTQQLLGNATPILSLMNLELLKNQAILVLYENNIDTGMLTVRPLSIVTEDRIIRLEY